MSSVRRRSRRQSSSGRRTTAECTVCGQEHPGISEALCYVRHEKEIRSQARPRVKRIGDLFNEHGNIRGEFIGTDMEDKLLRYHRRAALAAQASSNGRLPIGIRQALKLQPIQGQLSHRYPWSVVVIHRGKRYRKLCPTLGAAVILWVEYREKGYNATVVSRVRGYDIPAAIRGKVPPGWLWCPHCMQPRRFRPVYEETFYGLRKRWNDTKHRYEWVERKLQLLECPLCHASNRSESFRRSNQKWEKVKLRPGARRVKARHKTKRKGVRLMVQPTKKRRRRWTRS